MSGRVLVLMASIVLLLAHVTGSMAALIAFFDLGVDPGKIIYLSLLPFAGLLGVYLLSDGR